MAALGPGFQKETRHTCDIRMFNEVAEDCLKRPLLWSASVSHALSTQHLKKESELGLCIVAFEKRGLRTRWCMYRNPHRFQLVSLILLASTRQNLGSIFKHPYSGHGHVAHASLTILVLQVPPSPGFSSYACLGLGAEPGGGGGIPQILQVSRPEPEAIQTPNGTSGLQLPYSTAIGGMRHNVQDLGCEPILRLSENV